MRFYNRDEELKELRYFKEHKPSMIVVTGRRRIGKTALVRKVQDAVYLFVDAEKSEKLLIQELEILIVMV